MAFKRWVTYLRAWKNTWEVQMRAPKVSRQANSDNCGVYILAFVDAFLKHPLAFIEAVEYNKNLSWKVDASALRKHMDPRCWWLQG